MSIYTFYLNPLRPALFTLLFFTIELYLIFQAERSGSDTLLAWMIPLFFFWANFHIQFVYGMFVFVLYVVTRHAASAVFPSANRLGDTRSRYRLLGILALTVLCSCIGPNGARPHMVALEYTRDLSAYQVIQELGALNFRRPEHFAQLLLLMAACFVAGKSRGVDLFRPLLLIVAALVSFRAMRDSWFVSIASGLIVADAMGHRAFGTTADSSKPAIRPEVQYALAALLAIGVSFAEARREGISVPDLAGAIDGMYPLRAAEFIERSDLKGPMYNDFNWGGFLLLRLPEYPVSIDPRADLYDTALFAQSLKTCRAEPGWQQDPDLARANFVVIQKWFPLAAALANDTHFRLVYQDHVAAVFVRVG